MRKIAPRVYTSNLEEAPETVVRRNWYRVVSDLFPDAFLSHRSALERMPTPGGHLYIAYTNKRLVKLPGLLLTSNWYLEHPKKNMNGMYSPEIG